MRLCDIRNVTANFTCIMEDEKGSTLQVLELLCLKGCSIKNYVILHGRILCHHLQNVMQLHVVLKNMCISRALLKS